MGAQQLWLMGDGEPSFDRCFGTARRLDLGRGAWMEHVRGWVAGHDVLFAELERAMAWRAERRVMYDKIVDVPRLLARVPDDGPGHPLLPRMAEALGARYGAHLDAITLALYRDGHDSVAWHRDHDHRDRERCVVAVISLGGARRFLVRPLPTGVLAREVPHGSARSPAGVLAPEGPHGSARSARTGGTGAGEPIDRSARTGGTGAGEPIDRRSIAFTVAAGDVLVMGGTCQRTVEHCVPKTQRADPRIAIMFRHTEPIAPRVR